LTPSALLDDHRRRQPGTRRAGMPWPRRWAPAWACRTPCGAHLEAGPPGSVQYWRCICTTRQTRVALPVCIGTRDKAFPGCSSATAKAGRHAIATRGVHRHGDPRSTSTCCARDLAPAGSEIGHDLPADDGQARSRARWPSITPPRARYGRASPPVEPRLRPDRRRRQQRVVFEQTREDSVTDPLNGPAETRFPLLSCRARTRPRRPPEIVGHVMLLDLDNLKPLNDTFGHQAGNRALCAVAAVLRGAIRPYDICVSTGATSSSFCCPISAPTRPRPNASSCRRPSRPCVSAWATCSACG